MGATIRIHQLAIKTRTEEAVFQFSDQVTVVTGSIGVGKSSLLELLKFGLGATSAKLMPAVEQNVTAVEVQVTFGSRRYTLIREVGQNTVDVVDYSTGELIGPWSVTNRKYMPKASQELLAALGLPADLRIPRKRTKPTSETVGVSFFDLYKYIYLGQNDIDTQVVGHANSHLDLKRRAVFELVYGLNSPELIDLAILKGKWADRATQLKSRAEAIKDFLAQADEPEAEQLESLERDTRRALEEATSMLDNVRNESGAVLEAQRGARERVSQLRRQLGELIAVRDATAADVRKSGSLMAQLRLDQQALQRADVAHRALSGLEFASCPRCLQDVRDREVPIGHCLLCTQPEEVSSEFDSGELKRLAAQISETQSLLNEDEEALELQQARVREVEEDLAEVTMELERTASALISPQLEEVQGLAMEIARYEAQLEKIESSAARWSNYQSSVDEASDAEEEAVRVAQQESALQEDLSSNQSRIDDLSLVFNEIVGALQLPWYVSAKIDEDTYLPIVNGAKFDDLSVGGARKTIVNLAYHLANLKYGLSHPDTLYPTILIIDSPRKNIGQTAEDSIVGEKVYEYIMHLRAEFEGSFQVIIADNDVPTGTPEGYAELHFTYDAPLVPGVSHPGEGVETV
ncbi:AAA family ATPase [Streptomyces sp. NPDC088736]|uniref:AAA family ATPase n=1 Tax=Streptomyces sp. NPDC088736 TaxID=3365881 RepID=UPI00382F41CA